MKNALTLFALLLRLGCGSSGGNHVPVTGRVTLDGQPIAKLAIHLKPQGKTEGNGSLGVTDTEGMFTLSDVRGPSGAFVGEYLLVLNENGQVDLPKAVTKRGSPKTDNTTGRVTIPDGGCKLEILVRKDGQPPQIMVQKK